MKSIFGNRIILGGLFMEKKMAQSLARLETEQLNTSTVNIDLYDTKGVLETKIGRAHV